MRQNAAARRFLLIATTLASIGLALLFSTPAQLSLAEEPQDITPFEDFACLNCHTDKSRLTELAVEEPQEEEAALSSGPG